MSESDRCFLHLNTNCLTETVKLHFLVGTKASMKKIDYVCMRKLSDIYPMFSGTLYSHIVVRLHVTFIRCLVVAFIQTLVFKSKSKTVYYQVTS